ARTDRVARQRTEQARHPHAAARRSTCTGYRLCGRIRVAVPATRLASADARARTDGAHGTHPLPDAERAGHCSLLWAGAGRRAALGRGGLATGVARDLRATDAGQPLVAGAFPLRADGVGLALPDLWPAATTAPAGPRPRTWRLGRRSAFARGGLRARVADHRAHPFAIGMARDGDDTELQGLL